MPGVLQQPNLLNLPDWVKTANIQDGAVTYPKIQTLADQGVLGRGADGAGQVDLLSPSADGQLLKRAAGNVGFSALNSTDWAPLLAAVNAWAARQTFNVGATFLPGTAPASPVEGLLDYITGEGLNIYNGTAWRPLYREGTYTPELRFDTVGTSSWSYTTQLGTWVKIGRMVIATVNVVVTPTLGTGSGTLRVLNLPFTSSNDPGQLGAMGWFTLAGLNLGTVAGVMQPMLSVSQNSTTLLLRRVVASGTSTTTGSIAASNMVNAQSVTMQGVAIYFTNET